MIKLDICYLSTFGINSQDIGNNHIIIAINNIIDNKRLLMSNYSIIKIHNKYDLIFTDVGVANSGDIYYYAGRHNK